MPINIAGLVIALLQLANEAPTLTAEGLQTAADIAHGTGGIKKVQQVLSDITAIANTVATGAKAPPATPPQVAGAKPA